MPRIVLIAGFESFNAGLYRQAAELAQSRCPELEIWVFSDRDLAAKPEVVETALEGSDVFFASLLFDYDQVMWLRERVQDIPIRLIFESALELMALTQLGKFVIGEKPKGMPKPVQFILSKFGSGKEEDKLAGYLSFLKVGPKLLKFIPARKVQDLRNWLVIYGYWNAGGSDNVSAMFWYLAEKYLGLTVGEIPEATETPNVGLLHPDYDGYFESPREYLEWYWGKQKTGDRNQNSEFKGVHPPIHPSTHPPIHPSTHPPSSRLLLHTQLYGLLIATILVIHYSLLPLSALFSDAGDLDTRMLFGWSQVAAKIEEKSADLRDEPLLFTTDYRSASALAYQLNNPTVMALSSRIDQFDFWYDQNQFQGKTALILGDDWHPICPELLSQFEQTSPLETISVTRFGVWIKNYYLLIGSGFNAGPDDQFPLSKNYPLTYSQDGETCLKK